MIDILGTVGVIMLAVMFLALVALLAGLSVRDGRRRGRHR